ncbi:MAG: type 1 glutamine amidotransferase [Candidatus Nanohalobium sp.]
MFNSVHEVAVIDATLEWPRYSNRFNELLGDDIEKYKAMKHEFPEDPEVVIISGSTTGIYEDEEWIDALVRKTREYIEDDVPVLGLCFGHQVIAKAMGADVVQMDSYEIGYRPVEVDSSSEIFEGLDTVEYPFNTHQDKVVDMPEELEAVAETEVCNQAFQHVEKPVYGVQFHPELTPPIKEKAIRTKDMPEEKKKRLMREVNDANFHRAKRVLKIFENFFEQAEKHHATASVGDRRASSERVVK